MLWAVEIYQLQVVDTAVDQTLEMQTIVHATDGSGITGGVGQTKVGGTYCGCDIYAVEEVAKISPDVVVEAQIKVQVAVFRLKFAVVETQQVVGDFEISGAFYEMKAEILVVADVLDFGGNIIVIDLELVGFEVYVPHFEETWIQLLPLNIGRLLLLLVLVGNGEAGVDETDIVNLQDEVFGILFGFGNFLCPCGNIDDAISFVGEL